MAAADNKRQITDALSAGTDGTRTLEAAVALLTDSGYWLDREDFTGKFIVSDTRASGTPAATVDWEAAAAAVVAGELPCGSEEQHVLELAASLAIGVSVDLGESLGAVGDRSAVVVLQAIAHAAGQKWLSAEGIGGLGDLLTTLDNFLRSSPKVTDALTVYFKSNTGAQASVAACIASVLTAEVSYAAATYRQMTSSTYDKPVERIGVTLPEQTPAG
jgi:hypothetical protein